MPVSRKGPSGEKVSVRYEQPEVDATVVDGAAMVQMNAPKTMKTFAGYSKVEIGDKVHFLPVCEQQLDIVFDVYQKQSRKRETWEGFDRKDGVRLSIKKKTAIYTKFAKVLKFDDNKTELSNLIVKALSGLFRNQQKILLIT